MSPVVTHDGVTIDDETGEVLGYDEWRADSLEKVEWVLEKMLHRETTLAALKERKRALDANIDAMILAEQKALAGLHRRFGPDLEQFARAELFSRGARTKTLMTPFGSISFRIVQGTVKIVDMARAVAWAEDEAPDIVRKEVTPTDLADSWKRTTGTEPEESPLLLVTPGGERMYVRTGVAK